MDRKAIARVILAGVWRGFLASLIVPLVVIWRELVAPQLRSLYDHLGGGGGGMTGGGGGGGGTSYKPVQLPTSNPPPKEGGE